MSWLESFTVYVKGSLVEGALLLALLVAWAASGYIYDTWKDFKTRNDWKKDVKK